MTDLILYTPGLAYFAFASLMFALNKFSFGLHSTALVLCMTSYFWLTVTHDGNLIIAIIQTVLAVVSFVLMVFFFAGKASGETMISFAGIMALSPFALGFGRGLMTLGMTIVLLLIYSAVFYNKQLAGISKIAKGIVDDKNNNVPTDNTATLKDTLLTGLYSTYNGQIKAPDYSYLPDKSDTVGQKKISISVFAFASFLLVALGDFLYLSFLLDK